MYVTKLLLIHCSTLFNKNQLIYNQSKHKSDFIGKFMSLLGTADSGMSRACQSLKVLGKRLNLYPGTPPTTRLLVTLYLLYAGEVNDHYDGRPSSPHLVRGVYYYPYNPRVPFDVDLRLEVGYSLAPVGDTKDIQFGCYMHIMHNISYIPKTA